MITYAGIGSRKISETEEKLIEKIAEKLADAGLILYSGNAEGSDIAFQKGSKGKCVIILPWKGFNKNRYSLDDCIANIEGGKTPEGIASIAKYHPAPQSLTYGGQCMMARNYHQIMGFGEAYKALPSKNGEPTEIVKQTYPPVSFVICCANRDENKNIIGGTGQACRIATDRGIPVFNIRDDNWKKPLTEFLRGLKNG